jgi:sugar phosphate isomerase/epimerase
VAAFAKSDVVLAEVGRWVNLMDADDAKRKKNLETVTDGLALAEALGARCCVDIAGSLNETSWFGPHPGNLSPSFFDAAVENARRIVDAVKPRTAKFCYEMMAWSLPDTVDACLRMVKAVDRSGFGVHLDPCNLVSSPERYYRSADVVRECYAKLAPWVASVHLKDLTWDVEMAVHFREIQAGLGSLDHAAWLAEHAKACPEAPLMLEHLETAADYDAVRDHLRSVAPRAGIAFE